MAITSSSPLFSSNPSKLFDILRTTSTLCLLRHHSTTTSPPLDDTSVITKAVELLQSSTSEELRDTNHSLNNLLTNTASSFPSQRLIFQIAHQLPSTSEALKFLHYLKHNAISATDANSLLSSVFQAVFDLASRERDFNSNLYDVYKMSSEWNVPLTADSATLLLRCFGRCGFLEEALSLFSGVKRKNVYICNIVIDLLLQNGRVEDAFKVLDEMLQMRAEPDFRPNCVTRNVVVGYFLNREKDLCGENISNLVLRFGEREVFPNSIQLTRLITRLCRSGETCAAWDILWGLLKSGGSVEIASWNALLTGLGRARDFKKMNELMEKMVELGVQPNVITFGILINHMCKSRRIDGAMEVFQRMSEVEESDGVSVEPDVTIYNTLIDGLCKVGRQEEGLGLMQRMRSQKGCAPNSVTYNCLIDGFCKAGEIEKGQELFDEMKKDGVLPNAITLNTLLNGMCRVGRTNSALHFFDEMQEKGLKGNAVSYSILINAFCYVNNVNKAMEIFDQMMREGCVADAMVYYTLISGLSRAGSMINATHVLSKLKEAGFYPDVVCYNNLIRGFCNRMMLDKTYEILEEMENNGVKPDVVTYNTLISHFSKTGDFRTVHKIMRKMTKDGLAPSVVTYGALMHAYCLNGNIDKAMRVFKDMGSTSNVLPNAVIYNILIEFLCKSNDVEVALSLMDDMIVKGVKPNTNTYNAIFKGLREKNMLKHALALMDRMTQQACDPDYITLEILTEWLTVVGETEKLKIFIQGKGVSVSNA